MLRRPRTRPAYRRPAPDATWLQRACNPITQPQPWLDLTHGVLSLPVAVVSFTIVLFWWATALAGSLYFL